jgi:hypothetical protein
MTRHFAWLCKPISDMKAPALWVGSALRFFVPEISREAYPRSLAGRLPRRSSVRGAMEGRE